MSVWPHGTTYAAYRNSYNPSEHRERKRKMNMPRLQLGMMNYISTRYADNLPGYCGAYGFMSYVLLGSAVFYACSWLGTFCKKWSISCGLSISQTTESGLCTFSSVLLCIFLGKWVGGLVDAIG